MAPPRFTPRQLDAFVAAAELSNFTQAARRLNLTPSAVSNLITELEGALGFAIFERTTRKVVLTADGREFLPAALAVQRQMRLATIIANDVREQSTDVVRIAAPLAVSATLLPNLIAAHRRRRPRVTLRIVDAGVEWLADRVVTGEADMALGPDRSVGSEVTRRTLFATPWVVWCAPDHPLAQKAELTWGDLRGSEFYAAGRDHEHSLRPLLDGVPDALAIVPVQVVDNITTALGIAAAGLGFTCSPSYVRDLAAPMGLVMRRLLDPEIVRYMSLYTPAERKLTRAASDFADFVAQTLNQGSA